jgi:hypothetical protein
VAKRLSLNRGEMGKIAKAHGLHPAAMQQIAAWLKKLGMSAQRFAENDIDASVLPELTDQDLKDLGVSLGNRRKMLRECCGPSAISATSRLLRHPPRPWRPSQLGKTTPSVAN